MTANWSFTPVCGTDFWRVIVTSPEVMIFLFFMITDPKTVPAGRVGRVAFGFLVAATSTLLMAPQTDEFGTKVGLLAGLVVLCAARPLLDRLIPAPASAEDDLRRFARRLVGAGGRSAGGARGIARAGLAGVAVLGLGVAIVAAGTPARGVVVPAGAEALTRGAPVVDPATLPPITVRQDVVDFDHQLAGPGMQTVVVSLAQNLELENRAVLQRDATILPAIDHGDRLIEAQARINAAVASGSFVVTHYDFDAIDVSLLVPFGRQDGLSLGLAGIGTKTEETYDAAGRLQASQTSPFDLTFAMRRATGARWLTVAVLPRPPGG